MLLFRSWSKSFNVWKIFSVSSVSLLHMADSSHRSLCRWFSLQMGQTKLEVRNAEVPASTMLHRRKRHARGAGTGTTMSGTSTGAWASTASAASTGGSSSDSPTFCQEAVEFAEERPFWSCSACSANVWRWRQTMTNNQPLLAAWLQNVAANASVI